MRRDVPAVRGLGWVLASEVWAGAIGFGVMIHLARRLGPSAFARVEFGAAVAAWLLVAVRSGIEAIVNREAARRPRLIGRFTDLLIGLKLAGAVAGYAAVLAVAAASGSDRGGVVAVAGLVLVPAALVADVGPRATGRLATLALAQGLRTSGLAVAAWVLVASPRDAIGAASLAVLAESLGCAVFAARHVRDHGWPRPRYRRRAWTVLARRGAVASLARFARVGLYGADLLVLGWWTATDLGPYAAARRIVFALVALGLVVPASIAPAIGRAWAAGADRARMLIGSTLMRLNALAWPATIGLVATAGRWMPLIFGPGYRRGGIFLALIAVRLPFLLAGSTFQAALVACRREGQALGLLAAMAALAGATLPLAALAIGPAGVAIALVMVELAGAIGGWLLLWRSAAAPAWHPRRSATVAGCLALTAACAIGRSWPLGLICGVSILMYGLTWGGCHALTPFEGSNSIRSARWHLDTGRAAR